MSREQHPMPAITIDDLRGGYMEVPLDDFLGLLKLREHWGVIKGEDCYHYAGLTPDAYHTEPPHPDHRTHIVKVSATTSPHEVAMRISQSHSMWKFALSFEGALKAKELKHRPSFHVLWLREWLHLFFCTGKFGVWLRLLDGKDALKANQLGKSFLFRMVWTPERIDFNPKNKQGMPSVFCDRVRNSFFKKCLKEIGEL